jgi:hypothetical protein
MRLYILRVEHRMNLAFFAPIIITILFVALSFADSRFGSKEQIVPKKLARQTAIVFASAAAVAAATTYAAEPLAEFLNAVTNQPTEISASRPPDVIPGKPGF